MYNQEYENKKINYVYATNYASNGDIGSADVIYRHSFRYGYRR